MSVATATILSEGKAVNPAWELLSLAVRREVNRIPSASLAFVAGTEPQAEFKLSEAADFQPGAKVEIKLRYEGEPNSEKTVFKGLVTRHGIQGDRNGCRIELELKDAAVCLTQGRQVRVFSEMRDDQIIGKLIQDAGLKKGALAQTASPNGAMVQYECTDWDFILSRAEANGCVVVVVDGQVSLTKLAAPGSPKLHFEYGIDEIYDLEMEIDGSRQAPEVQGVGWDLKEQKPMSAAKAKPFSLAQGNVDGKKVAGALGFPAVTLRHPAPAVAAEMQAWADGRLARGRMALTRGRLGVVGTAAIALLDTIELKGLGARFNGKTLVTGLCHRVAADGWRTDVQFGLAPRWFAENADILSPPAAGLLPGNSALQLGLVQELGPDPDKEVMLKVALAGAPEGTPPLWARWAAPDAGTGRGCFFLPEVGDEVVVGFCNGDPRQPIILGSLYGSKHKPPEAFAGYNEKNLLKGFVTRKGTKIVFNDDDKPSVSIETPGGNKVLLDDASEAIKLADKHGNEVTLDKNGIVLKSIKDLGLQASGEVTIKGSAVNVQ